ncbi:MAG: YIP1 family protein [Methanospirillum sp.]
MALSITEKIQGFILRPVETYRAVRDETFGDAITYFVVLLIINAILSAIVGFLGFSAIGMPGGAIAGAGGVGAMIAALIGAVIFGIIGLIVGTILLHIGVVIMGGHGGIMQTFKAVVYGLTPYYLLGWIPIIGALAGIWGLIIEILGIRELHDMTTGRAVIAWVISLVIVIIIVVILAVIVGLAFLALFGIASSSGPVPV